MNASPGTPASLVSADEAEFYNAVARVQGIELHVEGAVWAAGLRGNVEPILLLDGH
jgi:hypothetical protein